jgi:hypothetical protein
MRDSSSGSGSSSSSSSSSPLAQLLAADPQLFKVAEAYTELQWLHHMAIQKKLQQYGPIAATLPGFAYACAAQAQGQANTKQPGDSIELSELYTLCASSREHADAWGLGPLNSELGGLGAVEDPRGDSSSSSSSPLALFARDLYEMLASGLVAVPGSDNEEQQQEQQLLSDLRLLVLPDLGTLLLESLDPAGNQLPSTARQAVQSTPTGQPASSRSAIAVSEQLVASLLQHGLAPPAPGSTPLRIEQPLHDFVAALGGMR